MIPRIASLLVFVQPLIIAHVAFAGDPAKPVRPTWPPKGTPVKVKVTRDTWLSSIGRENVGSNGGVRSDGS